MSIEAYIKELIEGGYINNDGTPIKCQFCDSVSLETNCDYGEFSFVIEKVVHCNDCDEAVGHWDHGNWSL